MSLLRRAETPRGDWLGVAIPTTRAPPALSAFVAQGKQLVLWLGCDGKSFSVYDVDDSKLKPVSADDLDESFAASIRTTWTTDAEASSDQFDLAFLEAKFYASNPEYYQFESDEPYDVESEVSPPRSSTTARRSAPSSSKVDQRSIVVTTKEAVGVKRHRAFARVSDFCKALPENRRIEFATKKLLKRKRKQEQERKEIEAAKQTETPEDRFSRLLVLVENYAGARKMAKVEKVLAKLAKSTADGVVTKDLLDSNAPHVKFVTKLKKGKYEASEEVKNEAAKLFDAWRAIHKRSAGAVVEVGTISAVAPDAVKMKD